MQTSSIKRLEFYGLRRITGLLARWDIILVVSLGFTIIAFIVSETL